MLNISNYKIKFLAVISSIIIFFIDQVTKQATLNQLLYHKAVVIFNITTAKLNFGFNLYLTYNYGTAFSLIKFASNNTKMVLIACVFIIIVALLSWLYKENVENRLTIMAVSCILGGALGNLYDRIMLGYVVDFLDVYIGIHHWPIFNVADIAVSIGVGILLWQLLFNYNFTDKK